MAPRGVPTRGGRGAARGGANPRNLAPRSQPPTRGARRGGIEKKRQGDRLRVDRDGDLVMGTMTDGSNKRARAATLKLTHGPGGLQVTRAPNTRSSNTTTLKVTGLKESKAAQNEGGGLTDLISFLERKAQSAARLTRTVRIKKSRIVDPFVYILISKEDGEAILAINGFTFAGTSLKIESTTEDIFHGRSAVEQANLLSADAQQAKEQLTNVLQKRYNPEGKFLDLSALGDDQDLRGIGAFEPGVMPEKLFKALMKICNDTFATPEAKKEAVVCVSLAKNSLNDVQQVYTLCDTFPDLKQLDLSNNSLQSTRNIGRWRHKFRHLEGLLVLENPMCQSDTYSAELLKWYPRLQNLNHATVRTLHEAEAAAAEAAKRKQPQPIPQTEAVYVDPSGVAEPFIREFFPGYDSSRLDLLAKYYDSESTFTLNVDTEGRKSVQNQPVLPWSAYIQYSRNLLRITTKGGRFQRSFHGPDKIADLWKSLPITKHPDLSSEFNKYIIECRQQDHIPDPSGNSPSGVMGLHIVVTGEFMEQHSDGRTGKRSFARSITLGPGRNQPVRVINDMLSLRAHRGVPPISEVHQNIQKVHDLSEATKMTLGYAEMCLGDVDYDYEAALRLFEEKKAELPMEAFITEG